MDIQGISQETMKEALALARASFEKGGSDTITVNGQVFQKAITTALGATGYNLAAPSQKLYPVLSPLRNMVPRKMAAMGATTANWKAITGINTSRVKAAVAFGARNTDIAFTLVSRAATYKSFGLDGKEQDEAVWFGRKFEDVRSFGALSVLQAVMIEEENLILGGVSDVNALGTCATPSATITRTANDGGTWAAADNVYVKCVALPLYGVINSYTGLGVGSKPLPLDLTQSLADHSQISAVRSQAITATTDSYIFTVAPQPGAWAYAWFVGEGAVEPATTAEYLAGYTTAPTIKLKGVPSNLNIAASTITADTSGDVNAFDGFYGQILAPYHTLSSALNTAGNVTVKQVTGATGSQYITNAIIADMANSGGLGTTLTSDGAFGVLEIDAVLKAMWDYNRVGPSLMLMNSQQAQDITKRVAGTAAGALRVQIPDGDKGVTGAIYVNGYLNKYTSSLTPGSPDVVPFMIHPCVPPGTIIFHSTRCPYPNANIENVLEMEMQQEYADFEWARDTREYKHGVYANGVLKHQFPAGDAILRGVAAG